MKISSNELTEVITEVIKETLGLDHSNRGREEPLGDAGPVVEQEDDPRYDFWATALAGLKEIAVELYHGESGETPQNLALRLDGIVKRMTETLDQLGIMEEGSLDEYEQVEMNTTGPRGYGRYLVDDEGNKTYLGPATHDYDNYEDVPKDYGMYDDEKYEEVKKAVREALMNEKEKGNPWAICTDSVGRDDKAKYERCVQDIKKKTGYKG